MHYEKKQWQKIRNEEIKVEIHNCSSPGKDDAITRTEQCSFYIIRSSDFERFGTAVIK